MTKKNLEMVGHILCSCYSLERFCNNANSDLCVHIYILILSYTSCMFQLRYFLFPATPLIYRLLLRTKALPAATTGRMGPGLRLMSLLIGYLDTLCHLALCKLDIRNWKEKWLWRNGRIKYIFKIMLKL